MARIFLALALAVLSAGRLAAEDSADAMGTVRQFVDAFNSGDMKKLAAACSPEMSIIDEFPPHEWHGSGALAKWLADYETDAKKGAITEGRVTLGKPRHVDVTGDYAYVVIPSNYSYKARGERVKETGSMFTFSLRRGAEGWRITGFSWAKN